MKIEICITQNGAILNTERHPSSVRPDKGSSIIAFPESFVVVDIETTGLDCYFDSIIEICAVKYEGGSISSTYSTLVNPRVEISSFIEDLTGISNSMLQNAPFIEDVLPDFVSFVSDHIIIGHNVNFDINFLYDACMMHLNRPLTNSFVDTMRIFRKLHPELDHHRLSDMVSYYHVNDIPSHRAEADCIATSSCYKALLEEITSLYPSKDDFISLFNKKHQSKNYNYVLRKISTENSDFDTSNPLFNKHCVFTGTLEKLSRIEAAQLVADLGGIPENGITKHTNFLILGNNDYCSQIKDGKSNKQKKAEEYMLKGYDISILSERAFYEMIELQ